jgi:hypothetical protein
MIIGLTQCRPSQIGVNVFFDESWDHDHHISLSGYYFTAIAFVVVSLYFALRPDINHRYGPKSWARQMPCSKGKLLAVQQSNAGPRAKTEGSRALDPWAVLFVTHMGWITPAIAIGYGLWYKGIGDVKLAHDLPHPGHVPCTSTRWSSLRFACAQSVVPLAHSIRDFHGDLAHLCTVVICLFVFALSFGNSDVG